jgi:signal transduction histidine kinase/CheY-like chemotaxis protein
VSAATPPARRSWPTVVVLVGMTALQVSVAAFSLYVLSAVRAYVAGESLYSKGQKDAQIYLLDYAQNHREEDYRKLVEALAVPIADRRAREALQRPMPDLEAARQAFIEGGNHPDDVPGLIRLFRWFGDTPLMAEAVATWTEGDRVIEQMRVLVERTRERVLAGHTDTEALRQLRAEAPALNLLLTRLESEFSAQLGEASRRTQRLLLGLNVLLAVLLAAAGIVFVRRSERSQAAAEALMDRLVGAVTDGVITFGNDRRIRVFNGAAERLFLTAADTAMGAPVDGFFADPLPPRAGAADAPAGTLHELTARRADASTFRVEASFSRVAAGADLLHTVVVRDITAREQAQAERQAREALEATNRAKTEFLSRMSHELRTPLNAVIGFAQLLRLDTPRPPTPQQLERIHHIERAGGHLLALVDDVLDLSRIESGELAIAAEAVELSAVAEEAATLVSPLVTRGGIELFIGNPASQGAAGDAVWVRADPVRLRQVLVNLLSNAVKYNRVAGSVTLTWKVTGPRCEVAVADTGQGMSPEQLERLFEPFNRLGAETSKVDGTGIGLVLSRRLVESMGGELMITSRFGEGTVATVRLEVMQPASPPATRVAPPAVPRNVATELDVLYAEDNEVNAELVRQVIALRPAITLRIADCGRTALELARERPPALMLVDMNLGDMNGLELARELRRHPRTATIELVALSADALPEQIDTAMQNGFRDYLTKPVDFRKLLGLLDERLQAR